MGELHMPSLGADMEAGTLIEWEKNIGDQVSRGDIIAVVETQKGAIEIEVYEDGFVKSYLVDIGTQVPVGTPLAVISGSTEAVGNAAQKNTGEKNTGEKNSGEAIVEKADVKAGAETPETTSTPASAAEIEKEQVDATVARQTTKQPQKAIPTLKQESNRIHSTPAARKLAADNGIDLASVQANGSGAAIVLADVQAVLQGQVNQSVKPKSEDNSVADSTKSSAMDSMRQAIAAAMARSKREIPHYYLAHTVDISNAEKFIFTANKDRKPADRLLLGALYIKAVANALNRYPEFSGFYNNDQFQPASESHIGMAINLRGGGLVAPAIHDVVSLELDAVMMKLKDLVSRVRAGRFRAAEISDSTITISSLGERGVDTLYGVIYPPQVAIVGFGSPAKRPVLHDEKPEWRNMVNITLAADHRVSDGHRGALFLAAIAKNLRSPEKL